MSKQTVACTDYSDRSGEIEKALQELHIVSEQNLLRVPQHRAVVERIVHVALLPCFWEFDTRYECILENA